MKYANLLSPIKIRNTVIKNRMESTVSMPHFSQGTEAYPNVENMRHFIGRAKNGAGIITLASINDTVGMPPMPKDSDLAHLPHFDIYDAAAQNYLVQFTEAIHAMGSIVAMGFVPVSNIYPYVNEQGKLELVSGSPLGTLPEGGMPPMPPMPAPDTDDPSMDSIPPELVNPAITDATSVETLVKIAKSYGQQAAAVKKLGFDMVDVHMSYRGTLPGKMLSPLTNKRTDEFGGDIKGRAKFPLMVLEEIRKACGRDFIIEFHVSGEEPVGGNTVDEVIEFVKMAEEFADIVQIRNGEIDPNHPTGFTIEKTPMLEVAAKIKASGTKMVVACVGGFFDPEDSEKAISDGQLDIVSMARAWISNPNYGELVKEGRGADIVPCVRCNRCHGRGPKDVMATVCTVNPRLGLESYADYMTEPVKEKKKIAIIGGGPGGMRSAILLADRGHKVVLYEASDELGGAIKHTQKIDFKWPLRDYKNYLIAQVEKRDIEVHLNTTMTPEALSDDFDTVICAIGAEPAKLPIPGSEGTNVVYAAEAMEHIENVGDKVVVIGGGEVGMEAAMYFAQNGKDVTVLEGTSMLAANSTAIHYRSMFEAAWKKLPSLKTIVNAKVETITADGVVYRNMNGETNTVPADTVVISVGMRAKSDEAIAFYGKAKEFYMVGDCEKVGSIQTTNRSVYFTSNLI